MTWLTLELAAKILIPIATFVLGIIATLIAKRAEIRRSSEQEHVKSLVGLTNDWYNQIHELSVNAIYNSEDEATKRAIYFYVNNRLILPKMLLHIEYLRHSKHYSEIVAEAERFLSVIATRSETRTYACKTFQGAIQNKESRIPRTRAGTPYQNRNEQISKHRPYSFNSERPHNELEELTSALDVHLQRITLLAGRALTR
jgi:hypothetical protein